MKQYDWPASRIESIDISRIDTSSVDISFEILNRHDGGAAVRIREAVEYFLLFLGIVGKSQVWIVVVASAKDGLRAYLTLEC